MSIRVKYTPEFDQILREEAAKHPNNLTEGFKAAAKIIRKMEGGARVTPERLSTRYYTVVNPVSGSKSRKQTGRTVSTRVSLFIDLAKELSKADKVEVMKNFMSTI